MEAPPILILTGPPGAGKSTVADLLTRASAAPAVHMHTDDFFDYIKAGFVPPWLPESRDQNHTISRAIAAAACQYALGGYGVVIDGVVGPWHLEFYQGAARHAGIGLDYIVLALDRAACAQRARERAVNPLPEYPPRIHEGLSDLGAFQAHALDVTSLTPDAVAEAIRVGRDAGAYRLA